MTEEVPEEEYSGPVSVPSSRREREPIDLVMVGLCGIGLVMVGFLTWWTLTVMM